MAVEYVHAECGTPIRYRDDGDGRTTYVCEKCEVELGFFIDGGEVDLDAVRAEVNLNPSNDFEVFL